VNVMTANISDATHRAVEVARPASHTVAATVARRRIGRLGAIALLFLLSFAGFAHDHAHAPAAPKHRDGIFPLSNDLRAALEQARREGKHAVAVLFEMNGCSVCAKLRATALRDARLRGDYAQHFVTVALMSDDTGVLIDFAGRTTTPFDFAQHERVIATPTVIFYDLDGLPVARQAGLLPVEQWQRLSRYVREAGYEEAPFSAWRPRAEPRGTDASDR